MPRNLIFFKNYLSSFDKKLKNNKLKPIDACLLFINNIQEIDKFIIGFTSLKEFKEILKINYKKRINLNFFDQFRSNNVEILNPSNW